MDDIAALVPWAEPFIEQLAAALTSVWVLVQLGIIAAAAALAFLFNRQVSGLIDRIAEDTARGSLLRRWRPALLLRVTPVIFLVAIWAAVPVLQQITDPANTWLLRLFASLATAWIAISVVTLAIRNETLSRLVSVLLWLVAAAWILGVLPGITAWLDGAGIQLGETRITALSVVQALVLLALLLWAVSMLARGVDAGLARTGDLSPSLRVLISKFVRVAMGALAVLVAIGAVGIDLTALAVLSGAIGLGIGFGLQRTVANFVAGVTVLLDKSIKPGDVISLGPTFGWISRLNARYVSVVTRDGREHLIPNEQFVSETVINWSYSDDKVRIEVPFGVAYSADPHQVRAVVIEALKQVPRVLPAPSPVVNFAEMADSALIFHARVWIRDPVDGVGNMRSAVLFAIWDALKAAGIEVPFPQRDIHLRTPVRVEIAPG